MRRPPAAPPARTGAKAVPMHDEFDPHAADDQMWRLKKLVAAKGGQVEALTMRVDVLADDLHECRQELEHEQKQVARLNEVLKSSQREVESYAARAERLEAAAAAAVRRADEAEEALEASQHAFAGELQEIKALAAAAGVEASIAHRYADPTELMIMRDEIRALEACHHQRCAAAAAESSIGGALRKPSPIAPAAETGPPWATAAAEGAPMVGDEEPWTAALRGAEARAAGEAVCVDKEVEVVEEEKDDDDETDPRRLRATNRQLRERVASLTEANSALHGEIESLSDQLICRTETELLLLQSELAGGGAFGRAATSSAASSSTTASFAAASTAAASMQPLPGDAGTRWGATPYASRAHGWATDGECAFTREPPGSLQFAAPSPPAQASVAKVFAQAKMASVAAMGGGDSERQRWQMEMLGARPTPGKTCDHPTPGALAGRRTVQAELVTPAAQRRGVAPPGREQLVCASVVATGSCAASVSQSGYAAPFSAVLSSAVRSANPALRGYSRPAPPPLPTPVSDAPHPPPSARRSPPRPVSPTPAHGQFAAAPFNCENAGSPGGGKPGDPPGRRPATLGGHPAHAHPPHEPRRLAAQAEAERRVRAQIRDLLVAKETAMMAVASL